MPPASNAVQVTLSDLLGLRLRARRLEQPAWNRVSGAHSAVHASRFRGRGVDYSESRNYQPGDDIRQMDWRVTARTGRPHTKLFQEERERNVLLVVSHNPSLRFGTRVRFKSVQAARAAALIAWAAALGGDRVGALGYGPGLNAEVKPGGGPRGALRVLRALVEWDAIRNAQVRNANDTEADVPLSTALRRAQRLARPGSQILLIGDGFDCDAAAESALALLSEHCDVAALLVTDPLEQSAPPPARYTLQSAGRRIQLDFASARTRAHWTEVFAQRRAHFLDLLRKRALKHAVIDTRAEPENALRDLLGLGARRAKALARKSA
ncbi:MAG TPA: DUF58 domain-containing protein [Rudaea sp.]